MSQEKPKPKSDIDEIRDSVKQSIIERVSSPLMGSFAISWVVVNWKGIAYFLLSKDAIVDRFSYIEKNYNGHLNLWVIPLFVSLLYVFVYPWPNFTIIQYRSYLQRREEEIRLRDEAKLRLVIQKRKNSEESRSLDEEVEKLNQRRESLSDEREGLEKMLAELNAGKRSFWAKLAATNEFRDFLKKFDKERADNLDNLPLVESYKDVLANTPLKVSEVEALENLGLNYKEISDIFSGGKYKFPTIRHLLGALKIEPSVLMWFHERNANLEYLGSLLGVSNFSLEQVRKLVEYAADLEEVYKFSKNKKMSSEKIIRLYSERRDHSETVAELEPPRQ